MYLLNTITLKHCPGCADIDAVVCEIDAYLSDSGYTMLTNARYGLQIPANTAADVALMRYRDILVARTHHPGYAGPIATSDIAGRVREIIYRNGL